MIKQIKKQEIMIFFFLLSFLLSSCFITDPFNSTDDVDNDNDNENKLPVYDNQFAKLLKMENADELLNEYRERKKRIAE